MQKKVNKDRENRKPKRQNRHKSNIKVKHQKSSFHVLVELLLELVPLISKKLQKKIKSRQG